MLKSKVFGEKLADKEMKAIYGAEGCNCLPGCDCLNGGRVSTLYISAAFVTC